MKTIGHNNHDWQLSRKSFLRMIVLSGVAAQLPWLNSCSGNNENTVDEDVQPFSKNQFQMIRELQLVLFPNDGNGPSALQVNADKYLLWIMRDPLLDPEEKEFMLKRVTKFEKLCLDKFNSNFHELTETNKTQAVKAAMQYEWGKKWISRMITLILEALLLDPIYGVNPEKIGWEWLQHNPGAPRPKNETKYPEILSRHAV